LKIPGQPASQRGQATLRRIAGLRPADPKVVRNITAGILVQKTRPVKKVFELSFRFGL
jgi:hypothetical protein